jgi:hypothetical protein
VRSDWVGFMKKILVIYYTQTGQLKQILDAMLHPLSVSSDFSMEYLEIKPAVAFPFPWTRDGFLSVFPESFLEIPIRLKPFDLDDHARYDLIILAFQPWYLSPSLPITAFLKSPEAERIMKGASVLTVIGSRNMWQRSYERVKGLVESLGGRLCGNIALIDRALNLVSLVSIVYWMFTGKKEKYLGIFPKPGISDADIMSAAEFGKAIGPALANHQLDRLEGILRGLGACDVNDSLARLENRAKKIFGLWAKLIIKHPKIRQTLLNLFFAELILGLLILSPLNTFLGIILKIFK